MPTITLPSRFADFLSGSSVIAHEPNTGYPAAEAIYRAWSDAYRLYGGGMRLTFQDADWLDALDCLADYAEVSELTAVDARDELSSVYDQWDYRRLSSEIAAARKMRKRIAVLRGTA